MRTQKIIPVLVVMVCLLVAGPRVAAQTQFPETWAPYASGVLATNIPVLLLDAMATSHLRRFYRARE